MLRSDSTSLHLAGGFEFPDVSSIMRDPTTSAYSHSNIHVKHRCALPRNFSQSCHRRIWELVKLTKRGSESQSIQEWSASLAAEYQSLMLRNLSCHRPPDRSLDGVRKASSAFAFCSIATCSGSGDEPGLVHSVRPHTCVGVWARNSRPAVMHTH